jgi:hypothetical protein
VVPGIGPVERDDIVKGFEYLKGRYVTIDPEDLKLFDFADDVGTAFQLLQEGLTAHYLQPGKEEPWIAKTQV